jgi:hypothetical protein
MMQSSVAMLQRLGTATLELVDRLIELTLWRRRRRQDVQESGVRCGQSLVVDVFHRRCSAVCG